MQHYARNRARRERRGTVMVMALIAITGLAILSAGFFQVVMGSKRALGSSIDDRRAYMLAEAGLTEGFTALRSGYTGSVGHQNAPAALGDGLFWVDSRSVGNNRTQLMATALVGSGRATVGTVVTTVPGARPLFARAITTQSDLELATGVVTDSFDSSADGDRTWAGQATNSYGGNAFANDNGGVRAEGDVILGVDAHVHGNVAYTLGNGLTTNLGSYVGGNEVTASEPFPFTAPQQPTLTSEGSLSVTGGSMVERPPGDYRFDTLEIGDGGRMIVKGPAQVVIGTLDGDPGGVLEVDSSGGPVTFFIENDYQHDVNFSIENSYDSQGEFSFQYSGSNDMVIPDGATLRGGYYAPQARVVMGNDTEVFGALTAQEVVTGERMRVHYDEVLASEFYTAGNGSKDSEIQAWFEAPVEPRWLRANRKDPYILLGVTPQTVQMPREAWL